MNKVFIYIIVIALCCTGVYLKFNTNLENIPIGCDEFGYLELAKTINENKHYQNEVERPYLHDLLDTLRKAGIAEKEFRWMIVPHAYYVVENTDKIINQYAPGTSYLLSIFPISMRREVFPSIAVFIFLFIPILIATLLNKNRTINWFDISLGGFLFFMTISVPFLTELGRVNSLAFTFALLLGAGMALETKPLLSFCLIVLSANFRVVNVLMLVPLIAFIPLPELKTTNTSAYLKFGIKYFFFGIVCLAPYVIYVTRLLGNPLLPTYGNNDTEVNMNVMENIIYYFNFHQPWFIFHLILIICLILLVYFKRINKNFFFKMLLFPLINYLFFIFHKIQIDYYPYASSFIMIGVCFSELNKREIALTKHKVFIGIFAAIACIIFADGLIRYKNISHKSFESAKNEYQVLCNYNIVWGDMLSGTTEYVCNNNGFKYGVTSPRARKITMKYLHDKKYSQAILLKDNLVERSAILNEINDCNLQYHIINDNNIGELLVINE